MTPKLRLAEQISFAHHRSGWGFALAALEPLLTADGVLLDSFLESTFCWRVEEHLASGVLPYRSPWVGFIHNPPGIPVWHEYSSAPQTVFATPAWIDSLPACRGIFTFSETMGKWVAERLPLPVVALIHPTAPADKLFDLAAYLAADKPQIVQVGSWLRRMSSIALLKAPGLHKICLICKQSGRADFDSLVNREKRNLPGANEADWSTVEITDYLDPASYDDLLSSSIVLLDLYDTTTNNAVVECIVRGTPLLCNRLPALVELLGADYPLFFSHLDEAAAKAQDKHLVSLAAQHLHSLPKRCFTGECFAESVANSQIYQSL